MVKARDDLRPFKLFGLTILQLMTLVAVVGIVLTAILAHYFPQLT